MVDSASAFEHSLPATHPMTRARGAATAMPPQMVLPPSPVPVDYPWVPSPPIPYDHSTFLDPHGAMDPVSPRRSRPPRRRHHDHYRTRRRSPTPSMGSTSSWGETGRRTPSLGSVDFSRYRRRRRPISRYYPESVPGPVPPPPISVYWPYESDTELGAYLGI